MTLDGFVHGKLRDYTEGYGEWFTGLDHLGTVIFSTNPPPLAIWMVSGSPTL